jgi:hypothetical protein
MRPLTSWRRWPGRGWRPHSRRSRSSRCWSRPYRADRRGCTCRSPDTRRHCSVRRTVLPTSIAGDERAAPSGRCRAFLPVRLAPRVRQAPSGRRVRAVRRIRLGREDQEGRPRLPPRVVPSDRRVPGRRLGLAGRPGRVPLAFQAPHEVRARPAVPAAPDGQQSPADPAVPEPPGGLPGREDRAALRVPAVPRLRSGCRAREVLADRAVRESRRHRPVPGVLPVPGHLSARGALAVRVVRQFLEARPVLRDRADPRRPTALPGPEPRPAALPVPAGRRTPPPPPAAPRRPEGR